MPGAQRDGFFFFFYGGLTGFGDFGVTSMGFTVLRFGSVGVIVWHDLAPLHRLMAGFLPCCLRYFVVVVRMVMVWLVVSSKRIGCSGCA